MSDLNPLFECRLKAVEDGLKDLRHIVTDDLQYLKDFSQKMGPNFKTMAENSDALLAKGKNIESAQISIANIARSFPLILDIFEEFVKAGNAQTVLAKIGEARKALDAKNLPGSPPSSN